MDADLKTDLETLRSRDDMYVAGVAVEARDVINALESRVAELEAQLADATGGIHILIPQRDRYRSALEQIRTGLGFLPYPREYPDVNSAIDALFNYADQALKG